MKKKVISLLLVLCLVIGMIPMVSASEVVAEGTCGENLTWVLTDDGTLTISGEGEMQNAGFEWSYYYTDTITKVIIGDGVSSIGNGAFSYCHSLTSATIPDSVTSIGDDAFIQCESLASVTIPDSVTTIGNSAFDCCTSLTHVTIPDSVTSIGNHAFYNCQGLTSVTIGNNVTTIGDSAFDCCTSLTHITIPANVTTIGNQAFHYCTSLTGIWVDAENPTYSSDAFGVLFDKNLTTLIQVPGGINGSYLIPDSVTTIGDYAFLGCDNLTNVTISNSVTSIGDHAFHECESLIGIWVDAENPTYSSDASGVLFDKDQTALIQAPGGISGSYLIPDSVTTIGEAAFAFAGLSSISIPSSITTIGADAFVFCCSLETIWFQGNAPTFGMSFDYPPFARVTANAYYPADNPTWTEDVMRNCGGNLTWIPYNPAEEPIEPEETKITDTETNVTITVPSNSSVSEISVEIVTEENEVSESVSSAVADVLKDDTYVAYDIEVEGHTEGEIVTVTLPIPNDVSTPAVYYVSDDGSTVTDMNAVDNGDGTVSFETNHFSIYVVGESRKSDETDPEETEPETTEPEVTVPDVTKPEKEKSPATKVKNLVQNILKNLFSSSEPEETVPEATEPVVAEPNVFIKSVHNTIRNFFDRFISFWK